MSQLLHETYSKLFIVIGQNVQISKFVYKISHENVIYDIETIVNNIILHIWKLLKSRSLWSLAQEKNWELCMATDTTETL